jgi:glycosyltransferase involved in cell wall biosynthesis
MKLLFVIHSLNPGAGGPVENLKHSARIMGEMGHQIEVATLDAPRSAWLNQYTFQAHALGPSSGNYGYSRRFVPWLKQNASQYDVVVIRGIWQFHSFGTWRALRRSTTPYVVFPHGMLDPWFKRTYPVKHVKKWLYWPWAEYRVLRDARAVLFTCEEERRLARESFSLYRCNEVVVNYGTAKPAGNPGLQREAFFQRYPELRGKRIALFMGRIHPKKGCDLLIAAFAEALASDPDWHLVMAGPDQVGWQEKLVDLARQKQVEARITWTDMVGGDVKYGALGAAEVFVLPSHQENFGIVIAEALALGVPALISTKVNIWQEVRSDHAGIVAKDDMEGVCSMLRSWLTMPAREKQLMKRNAENCFDNRFEITQSVISILRHITPLVKPSPNLPPAGDPSPISY